MTSSRKDYGFQNEAVQIYSSPEWQPLWQELVEKRSAAGLQAFLLAKLRELGPKLKLEPRASDSDDKTQVDDAARRVESADERVALQAVLIRILQALDPGEARADTEIDKFCFDFMEQSNWSAELLNICLRHLTDVSRERRLLGIYCTTAAHGKCPNYDWSANENLRAWMRSPPDVEALHVLPLLDEERPNRPWMQQWLNLARNPQISEELRDAVMDRIRLICTRHGCAAKDTYDPWQLFAWAKAAGYDVTSPL